MPFNSESLNCDAASGGCVAIGNFDGVHRGHQAMIAELRRQSDALGVSAVAVTFDPPPGELLRPDIAPPRLMRLQEKVAYLKQAGADEVVAVPTSEELLNLSAEDFFTEVLRNRLRVRGIVEGPNFRFGRNREGDVAFLGTLCERAGIPLILVNPVSIGERMISSTRVRSSISAAEMRMAAELLGRPHEVVGLVAHGASRGARFGFPTANLSSIETLLPPDGVYGGRAVIDGRQHAAAIHIGPNSTFGETARKVEAHLLGFSGDLYGRWLRLEFFDKIRDSMRFDSPEALVARMHEDCERVRSVVATFPNDR